jgi:hypothetical protein
MPSPLRLLPVRGLLALSLTTFACTTPNGGDATGGSEGSATGGRGTGGAANGSSGGQTGSGGAGGGSTASGGQGAPGSGGEGAGSGGAPSGSGGGSGGSGSGGGDAAPATEGGPPVGDPETPGATDLTKHKFSKLIKMDTTAAGANVAGDVPKYPVAVILTATNFDFTQAKAAGEDIRFSTMGGAPLSYAIESWDAAGKLAVVWVKVDVKGNDATQAIQMHWGNPDAASASSGKGVFNKEDGYLGVYHLADEAGDTPSGYKDASWNEAHLTGHSMDPSTRAPSRIGLGAKLANPGGQGKNQFIGGDGAKFENDFMASAAHPITASAWAWADSFGGYYETVISKGDRAWTIQRDYQGRTETCTWSGTYHSCAITKAPAVKKWTHFLIVQNTKTLTLFIDGKRAASAGAFGQVGPHGLGIGHNMQSENDAAKGKREWDGNIDEVRVMSVEKDANWIALEFESQREGSKFLSFGEPMMK